jgi:drug/metabolite transporter (DMT)-like permease
MPTHSGRGLLPWLSLLTIWIVWSSTYLGMSAAVETIPPFTMTAARFLIASPILIAMGIPAWRKGAVRMTGTELRTVAFIGILMLLGGPGLVGLGVTELDSSLAALVVAMSPIWMALFSALQTRTVPKIAVFGALVTGLIGIGIMVGAPGGDVPVIPALIVLVSTLFWSGGTVMSRFLPLPKHPTLNSGLQMVFGGLALGMVGVLRGEWEGFSLGDVSGRSWFGLLWLVIAGSLVAYSAYTYANATLPIEIVSTYAYVNPVIAVILGATLDDDAIGPNVLIGGGVIVLAVVFIVSGHVVRRRPLPPEDDLLADDPLATHMTATNTEGNVSAGTRLTQ